MATAMTRRGLLAAMGGAAALAGLSACALGGEGSKPATGPVDLNVDQSIDVWDYDSTGIDLWVKADQDFQTYFSQKYPKVKVNRKTAGFAGFAEALLTSIAGGAKYDVIYGWSPWLPQFVKNNVVSPLEPFLANDGTVTADSFHDYGKDLSEGKLYGLAWYASAQYLYYNKTALRQAGVPDPRELDDKGQWTYDSFQQLVRGATTKRQGQPIYGFDMGATRGTGDYNAFARGWGSDIWDAGYTKSLMDSPQNVALWQYIQDFYKQKLTPVPSEGSGLSETVGFGNQRVLMMISGANYFRTADQQKLTDKFEIGMSRLPKGPGGQSHVSFLNSYYMGSRGSNAGAGWAWYKERSFSPKAAELYVATGASRFPVLKEQKPVTVYDWEDRALFESIAKDMFPVRVAPNQTQFDNLYGAAWDRLALNSAAPQDLLTKLASDANALLKR